MPNKNKNSRYNASQLWESVIMEAHVQCTKCKRVARVSAISDDYEAAQLFFSDGWRQTPNNTYCPKCSKKYLKP